MSPIEKRDHIDAFAVGVMLFLTFSWGLNSVASKISNTGFNPVLVSLLRSGIACVIVYLWCRLRGIPVFNRDGTLWGGLLTGFFFGAEFICVFIGFDYTSVGRGSLMLNAMPFWVLIGAHFLLGERLTPVKIVGVILAFAGVYLIFSDRLSSPGPDAWIGDLLMVLGGIFWAATSLAIKGTKLGGASAEKVLLYQLAVSVVMTAPLLPFVGPLIRDLNGMAIASLLFQAIFVVAFTYLVWFWLMRHYPIAGLSTFAFLTPAFSVLLGGLLLGEPLTWKIALSLFLIACGLLVVNRPARTPG